MGADRVGLGVKVTTMSRLVSTVNKKMNKNTRHTFLLVWTLCESQENKFSLIFGKH